MIANKEIFLLFVINIISGVGYSLVAPLYPSIAVNRGLNNFIIGVIISIFAISNLFVTPFAHIIFKKIGKKKIFMYAIGAEALCSFVYGCLDDVSDYYMFIFLSLIFRIIHGMAASISAILTYSLAVSFVEEDQIIKSLGALEFGWNLGLASGPLLGAFLYYFGGYNLPFYFFSIIIFVCLTFIKGLEIIEITVEEEEENFFSHLFNYKIMTVFICVMVDCITKTFYFPTLVNHLQAKFGLDVEICSLFFVVDMIMYVVTLQVLNSIISSIGLKMTMLTGILLNAITVLFLPPINLLPQVPYSILIGLFISGISNAAVNVPSICELINILKENNKNESDKCNDIASSIWNLAVYSGESLGPLIGGYVTSISSFGSSCTFISLINCVFATSYFYLNRSYISEDLTNGYSFEQMIGDNEIDKEDKRLISNTRSNSIYSDFCDPYIALKRHVPHSAHSRKNSGVDFSNNTTS